MDDAAGTAAYDNGFEFKDAVKQENEYAYDANGNLTKDLNRNISEIQYNFLNLPGKVVFADGSTIEYVYAADGTKLKVVHKIGSTTTTTDYCGNVVYENGVQKLLLTEEGYVTLADQQYHYFLKDHQGNNRMVVNQSGTVEEVNHYYPFGGLFANSTGVQPYKYNGKELDTENGLNWYDYGARMYDPALGRFTTMDRFADKYSSMSPYQYGANNPVVNIDVNGDSLVVLHHSEGMHMGMLIQKENGKWGYYSINGDNVYVSGKFFGGRKFDDLGEMEFDTPRDFFESPYNSSGDGDDPSINSYGYAEGYVMPATPEQDAVMRETFTGISKNEEYDLMTNNCATAVQKTLESVGFQTFGDEMVRIPANHQLGESSYTVNVKNIRSIRPIVPSTSFHKIMTHNPQGVYVKRLK